MFLWQSNSIEKTSGSSMQPRLYWGQQSVWVLIQIRELETRLWKPVSAMWRSMEAQRLFSSWPMHLINLDTIIVGSNLIYLGLNKLHPLCWATIWIFKANKYHKISLNFKNKLSKRFWNFLNFQKFGNLKNSEKF